MQSVVWLYFRTNWAVCVLWCAGVVSTVVSFDRERQREYTLSVTATDQAEEPLIGICQITVLIGDQNDNDPKFENSRYQCKRQHSLSLCCLITNIHCSSCLLESFSHMHLLPYLKKSLWCWFNHKACLWIYYRMDLSALKCCSAAIIILSKALLCLYRRKTYSCLSFIRCSSVYREAVISSPLRHWRLLKHSPISLHITET